MMTAVPAEPIEDDPSRRQNLGEEIKIADVAGQHARTQLTPLQEHEGVI